MVCFINSSVWRSDVLPELLVPKNTVTLERSTGQVSSQDLKFRALILVNMAVDRA